MLLCIEIWNVFHLIAFNLFLASDYILLEEGKTAQNIQGYSMKMSLSFFYVSTIALVNQM